MRSFLIPSLLFLLTISPAGTWADADASLAEGVTLYASFDEGARANYAAGAWEFSAPGARAEGRVGQAFASTGEATVIPSLRNFDQGKGTLALWVWLDKPLLESDAKRPELLRVQGGNFVLRVVRHSKRVTFMTGTSLPGEDFKWNYGCSIGASEFPAKQWVHLALTWDAARQHRAIHLDGKMLAERPTDLMRSGGSGRKLAIGGVQGRYDELVVWDRVLSKDELELLATMPADAAKRLHQLPDERRWDNWPAKAQLVYREYADSLVAPGEAFAFDLPVTNDTEAAAKVEVRVDLLDFWSRPAAEPVIKEVELEPGQTVKLPMSYSLSDYGFYRVGVTTTVENEQLVRDVTTFGVLPAGAPPRHDFFGGHINVASTIPEMGRRLGFAGSRVHNMTQFTWWKRLQPEPDAWTVDERTYGRYLKLGYHHYGQWFAAPYWAVRLRDGSQPKPQPKGYPKPWVPTDEAALASYVKRTLTTFPEIDLWEIWNEPYVGTFWSGSPEQYVELARVIYPAAKAERPDITVYSQLSPDGGWIKAALKAGIMDYCDGVAWHSYRHTDTQPQTIRDQVTRLRELIAEYGGVEDAESVPLVMSEGGAGGDMALRGIELEFPSAPKIEDLDQARAAAIQHVQASVVWMSMGVKAQYFYLHQPVSEANITRFTRRGSTLEITNTPRPLPVAQAALVRLLDSGTYRQAVTRKDGDLWFYLYERKDGKTLVVAWAEAGASAVIEPIGQALNLMGNPAKDAAQGVGLKFEPVYFLSDASVEQVAKQLEAAELRDYQLGKKTDESEDGVRPSAPWIVAAEMGKERLKPVDLSSHANMGLRDDAAGDGKGGWLDEGPFNDMPMLERGEHTWLGVPFLVAGKKDTDPAVLTMRGKTFATGPKEVTIPISGYNKGFRGLFFAHAANYATKAGHELGEYVVRYTDGEEQTLPIIAGQNIYNWWNVQQPGEESRPVMFKHPNPQRAHQTLRTIRTWYWDNPRPGHGIESITVRSTSERSTFTLVGITIAGGR